uniref:Uncharacterized protein n=1 Tax=viral metagenome TaxID=1070528 RepID=A0A6M3LA55_9ZZZZ
MLTRVLINGEPQNYDLTRIRSLKGLHKDDYIITRSPFSGEIVKAVVNRSDEAGVWVEVVNKLRSGVIFKITRGAIDRGVYKING